MGLGEKQGAIGTSKVVPRSIKKLAIGRSEIGVVAKIFSEGPPVESIASKVVCDRIDSGSDTAQ